MASENRASTPARSPGEEPAERLESKQPVLSQPQGGLAVLRVLRHREFAIFWAGQAISLVGTWMQGFAQGWVVATLTSSAFALGLINFAMSLPTLLLMPLGGVTADRVERRRILIVTQWMMLVLAALTACLIAAHRLQLWHLYGIALLLGVATAYDLPAYQSFYPQLIEREDLPQAISLNQATFNGSRIIGPALASWFVARWGTSAAFFANAASFLAVIISLGFIRPRPPAVSAAQGRQSTWQMMQGGLAYVAERPVVQALLGLTGITTFFIFPNLAVLMPFYALHVLHVGPEGLGTMMSISGAGSFVGAVMMLNVPKEQRAARIGMAAGVIVVTMSVLAWSRSLWLSAAVIVFQSLSLALSVGLASVMVQEMVPDALRGRVMSLYSLMFTGVMPFAALIITRLADGIGMRRELQISALLYGVGALLLVWRFRWQSRRSPPPGEAPPGHG
jgi:MFS family permease